MDKIIKNAKLSFGGTVSDPAWNVPPEYGSRETQYFMAVTDRFKKRNLKYAADFFKGTAQGLYGPDVDESTISIPAEEIKAADERMREAADEIEPEGDDVTVVYKNPMVTDADIAAAKKTAEEKKEYSLEDIMREYGHDF